MASSELYLKQIEEKLLPLNSSFSDQQKEVLLNNDTLNIVAGPGSGKTTVLSAKCALLLNENKDNFKGLCLLTHTNVAVDEIKMNLNKLGYKNLEYPNFIGTIHEFFNTFFAQKAFHMILDDKKFRVLENDEYQERFNYYFDSNKPDWYTFNYPGVFKNNPMLNISEDGSFCINSSTKSSYRESFNKSIHELFKRGFITNNQCLELAKWYITKHKDALRKAINNRFVFALLDEAQDTSRLQYGLLNDLFLDNAFPFQRYGDPYQALYNVFENVEDTWVPKNEESAIKKYDISETSRFGENISIIVKNICIDKYDDFRSLKLVDSFKPHFCIYEKEDDLVDKYKNLIDKLNNESKSFLSSPRKDAIVSARHDDLSDMFSSYCKPVLNSRKSKSNVMQAYDFLLHIFSKELNLSHKETLQLFDLNLECKLRLGIAIQDLLIKKDNRKAVDILYEILKILNNSTEFKSISNINKHLENFKMIVSNIPKEASISKEKFYIGTIHSVKGETHRSTLLVLNSEFECRPSNTIYKITDLLKNYLIGNYVDLNSITNSELKNETSKALKLAYVALSRPTHLAAIAIPKSSGEDAYLNKLKNYGWIEF